MSGLLNNGFGFDKVFVTGTSAEVKNGYNYANGSGTTFTVGSGLFANPGSTQQVVVGFWGGPSSLNLGSGSTAVVVTGNAGVTFTSASAANALTYTLAAGITRVSIESTGTNDLRVF